MDPDAVESLIRRTRLDRGLPARIEDAGFYRVVARTMAGDDQVAEVHPLPRVDRGRPQDDPAPAQPGPAARPHLRIVKDIVGDGIRAALTATNAATLRRLIEEGYDPATGRWDEGAPPDGP